MKIKRGIMEEEQTPTPRRSRISSSLLLEFPQMAPFVYQKRIGAD
jgi:hypothetical protein